LPIIKKLHRWPTRRKGRRRRRRRRKEQEKKGESIADD